MEELYQLALNALQIDPDILPGQCSHNKIYLQNENLELLNFGPTAIPQFNEKKDAPGYTDSGFSGEQYIF